MNIDNAFFQILVFLSCLFGGFANCFGQTNISAGSVSGIWTKAGSPYVVNGNIVIDANQKLTIEPGTEVRFSGSYSLSVQGCLNATGNVGDSIRFTVTDKSGYSNNTHLGWRGIRFQNVVHTDSSSIVYCVLEYGKAVTGSSEDIRGGALLAKDGRLRIRNSVLRNNRAVYGGGIAVMEVSRIHLKDLSLQGNSANEEGGGIYSFSSDLTIIGCKVINNTSVYRGGGLYIYYNSTATIQKTIIAGNKGGAIKAFASVMNIDRSTIAGNTGAPDGFDLQATNFTCSNSILWNKTNNNTYQEISADGYGFVKLNYCIVKGSLNSEWKLSNTSTKDPGFINLAKFDVRLGWSGYPLKDETRSPAIDTGDPKVLHDPDGTIADIGALPFTQTSIAFPTVSFAADTTLGLIPAIINFDNYSTQAQGVITAWKWNFGDNTISTEKSPTHQYTLPGTYDVKLVATNQDGKKDSLTFTKYIRALGGTGVTTSAVEGIWTKQNSPYNIFNDITIPAGKTLTIEPGVQVSFFGGYALKVNGNLFARGTVSDSILFDQFDNNSAWHSIRIENVGANSDSTIFEYCRIAHTAYISGDVTTNGGNAVFVKDFDKVRISHCLLRNNRGGRGAGVYAEKASIMINDNVIRNNSALQSGAGIYIETGSPTIRGNRIERNYAGDGAGGIWLSSSKSVVQNNIISYNSCYWSGVGVMIVNNSSCVLTGNIISYNESGHDDGGGILISESSPKIINNTIAYNKSEVGEGVLIRGNSSPDFINTIIYANRDRYEDTNQNDEIYIESNARPKFYNCNIQGGVNGIVMYSGTYSGIAKNNINALPLFRNAEANDLSLSWTKYPLPDNSKSPCIDAGALSSPHDPDGSPTDIGAKYFHQTEGNFSPRADFVADTLLGFNSLAVSFKDLSDKGDGKITEWHWAFGDGMTSIEQNPVHVYNTEGRFDVSLTIKDETGFERKIIKEKYVRMISGVYVKGNVNGTFTAPRYLVGGDLLVQETKTLQVTPGVEFMFLGNYKLDVRGALKATGTSTNPIVFTAYDTTGLDLAHATIGYSQNPGGWGGIYVYASGAQDSTVINYCKIQFVENNGYGAIYAFSNNGAAGMRISNSEISYNSTPGIFVNSSKLIIRNNYIHHNYARAYQKGAGIYFYAGAPKVINNIITYNETADDGGGLCVDWDSRPSLIGNVITHNKAGRAGGICDYAGNMELINNTIAFNSSTGSSGGGYYILYAGDVKFTNNIIANNSPVQIEISDPYTRVGFRNCILQGGSAAISGYKTNIFLYENILTADPRLVTGKNSNGRLLANSPALNAGITTGITTLLPALDVVGSTRIQESQIDIGAYEYVAETTLSVVNPFADINKDEDFAPFTISLESVFGNQYGSTFQSYSIENTSGLLNVSVRDRVLYFSPVRDKFGDATITVTASNNISQVSSQFTVHIASVDDAPYFTVKGNLFVEEDFISPNLYDITSIIAFGEEGSQPRTFTLEPSSVDFATIQLNPAGALQFAAKPNLFGMQQLKITVTEGQLTYSEIFTFGVLSVNDPPVITVDNTPLVFTNGEEKILPVAVSDVEGDVVTLTAQSTNGLISLNSSSVALNQYNIVITGLAPGQSGVNLSASDGRLPVTKITVPVSVETIVGLEEEVATFETYPNPATDYIVVKGKPESSIILYNANGQPVMHGKVGITELTLKVGHLKPGLYLLQMNDGVNHHVFKVIKK